MLFIANIVIENKLIFLPYNYKLYAFLKSYITATYHKIIRIN